MGSLETDFRLFTTEQSVALRLKVSQILGDLDLLIIPFLPYSSIKKEGTATVLDCGGSWSLDGVSPKKITVKDSSDLKVYELTAVVVSQTPSSKPHMDLVDASLVINRGKWVPERSLIVTTPCDATHRPDATLATSKVDPVATAQFFEKGLWALMRLIY